MRCERLLFCSQPESAVLRRHFDASCIIVMHCQCVVYKFKYELCDADYLGYTCRHLHQRTDERNKGSVIGIYMRDHHEERKLRIENCFSPSIREALH